MPREPKPSRRLLPARPKPLVRRTTLRAKKIRLVRECGLPPRGAEPTMDERRSRKRQRVLKAGSIQISGGGTIDCTVRNLSPIGAALDVSSPVGIPDKFVLLIPSDALRVACRVTWRKAGRIGIRFD